MQIIVFKCKVNICDQDLGVYCRERDPERKNLFWPKRGATKRIAVSFEFAFADVSVGKEWHAGGDMVLRTCTGVGITLWGVPVQCRRL